MQFASDRQFKLWDYNVSHKQLLIRSPATPDLIGNVDLVFWQVEYLAIPTGFDGIQIAGLAQSERDSLISRIGKTISTDVFCLVSGSQSYFVAAGGVKVLSNELGIFQSTLVYFGVDHPIDWYGKVITQS